MRLTLSGGILRAGNIEVGSTITTFGPDGEETTIEKPSYLIKDDGTKVELTKEQAKQYGIGK
jgi:hypothetical protein